MREMESCNEIFEEELHEALTRMKLEAMTIEAKDFYSQYTNQTWKNIVSLGDAAYELHAAQELAFRRKGPARETLRLKAIRTRKRPTLSQLTHDLDVGAQRLVELVALDGDISFESKTLSMTWPFDDSACLSDLADARRRLTSTTTGSDDDEQVCPETPDVYQRIVSE
jgi:hypothetical protein